MRLRSFQVRLFRNVIDSGPIKVDDVTCLVGKNEAGKSALLQALHHLNPAKPQVSLDLLDEYPRWLKKEHEITGEIKDAVPITAVFEFSDEDIARFATLFGQGVISSNEVTAHRSYADPTKLQVAVSIDYHTFVKDFKAGLSKTLQDSVGDASNTAELIKQLETLSAAPAAAESNESNDNISGDAAAALSKLREKLSGHTNLRGWVEAEVKALIPRTFYFSSYSQLDGRYRLSEVFAAVNTPSSDESLQAAADFLQLARVVPQTVEDWDFEASNAELESISKRSHQTRQGPLETERSPTAQGIS